MKKQNVRTLSLVVCTFTYLLIGAAVFDALESDTEDKRIRYTTESRNHLLRKYNISERDFKLIETVIIESRPHKAGPQWKFLGAFYYAIVVVTAIGYGHSTPVTVSGKAFSIAYAMMGIPLGLVMFQSIGERLNKLISVVIRQFKSFCKVKKTEATEMDLMAATGFLSSIIVTTGAAVFSRNEGWTYFDSFYYCFVTLTTIGFGDYVALQNDRSLTNRPGYVAFSLVFILFGLAVVAGCMNLLVLRFMTMNAEDVKRDDSDSNLARGVLNLDNEFMGFSNKLAVTSFSSKPNNTAHDFDQVSVCSCTGCTCYGALQPRRILGLVREKKSASNERRNSRWSYNAQIHVIDSKVTRGWRREQVNMKRSSSRLSRLTFGIDALWNTCEVVRPAALPQLPHMDVYRNFQRDYSKIKRASI